MSGVLRARCGIWGVFVQRVDGLSPDFVNGVDVSSVLSLEESGVVFRDASGAPADLFGLLAAGGVNTVRVRVWNDPFDAEGHGYGGGNVDVPRAVEIGTRATAAGLHVLVDFHYSDFWADPARQLAPKAWQGLGPAETVTALHDFTVDSLQAFEDAGVDVTMVQVGNETNNGVAGYTRPGREIDAQFAALLSAGTSAVREVLPTRSWPCTSPTRRPPAAMRRMPPGLDAVGVDYDVFATRTTRTGTARPTNLTNVLRDIADHLRQAGHGGRDLVGAHPRRRRRAPERDRRGHHHRPVPRERAGPGDRAARRDRRGRGRRRRRHRRLLLGARVAPGRSAERGRREQRCSGSGTAPAGRRAPRTSTTPCTSAGGLRRLRVGQPGALRMGRAAARVARHASGYVRTGAVAPRAVTSVEQVALTVTDGSPVSLPVDDHGLVQRRHDRAPVGGLEHRGRRGSADPASTRSPAAPRRASTWSRR